VDRRDYKSLVIAVDQRSLEYEFITSSSSWKILRSGLRQLGADEEPEEVAGSCYVQWNLSERTPLVCGHFSITDDFLGP
jgi:hypothetical protein